MHSLQPIYHGYVPHIRRVGDRVIVPKSSQCAVATNQGTCPDETEDHTIAAISTDELQVIIADDYAQKFGSHIYALAADRRPIIILL